MIYSRSVTTEVAVREEIYRRVRIKVSLGEGSEVEENEDTVVSDRGCKSSTALEV